MMSRSPRLIYKFWICSYISAHLPKPTYTVDNNTTLRLAPSAPFDHQWQDSKSLLLVCLSIICMSFCVNMVSGNKPSLVAPSPKASYCIYRKQYQMIYLGLFKNSIYQMCKWDFNFILHTGYTKKGMLWIVTLFISNSSSR